MQIQVNEKYRFIKIPYNVVIEERKMVKGKEKWDTLGYYTSLEWACKGLLAEVAWNNDFTEIKEIIKTIEKCKNEIVKAVEKHGKSFEIEYDCDKN